jgi:hypothetical protein
MCTIYCISSYMPAKKIYCNKTILSVVCDKRGLTFRIDGELSHYLGRCFRITIFPEKG